MVIYPEQIPNGYSIEDYPDGTEFLMIDDSPLERDPVTFKLLPREKRPFVYPKDVPSEG